MILFGYVVVVIISAILSAGFLKLKNYKFLNSESFRDSTKVAITITTLGFPILISSAHYFQETIFWHIIFTISISTLCGLWNSFSIATVTDENGKIKVGPNSNKSLPFVQVMQFFFMIYAVGLSVYYAKKPFGNDNTKEIIVVSANLLINKSSRNLIDYIGIPSENKTKDDTTFFYYTSKHTKTVFKLVNDSIVERVDTKIYLKNR